MNKKYIIQAANGKLCYCVLDSDKDPIPQLEANILGNYTGHGCALELEGNEIRFVDFYHASTIAIHKLLRIEDTNEALTSQWKDL